jgi:hypothetical protein
MEVAELHAVDPVYASTPIDTPKTSLSTPTSMHVSTTRVYPDCAPPSSNLSRLREAIQPAWKLRHAGAVYRISEICMCGQGHGWQAVVVCWYYTAVRGIGGGCCGGVMAR